MKRTLVLTVVFAFIAASCGDGAEDATPGSDATVAAATESSDPDGACEVLAGFSGASIFVLSDTPAEMRLTVPEARAILDELVTVAPVEIRPAVETSASYEGMVIDLYETVGFDSEAVDVEAYQSLRTAQVDAADTAIDGWMQENCI
jgi:hypothetical protein